MKCGKLVCVCVYFMSLFVCVCVCVVSAGPSLLCDGIRQWWRPDVSHSASWEVQRASRSVRRQIKPTFDHRPHLQIYTSLISHLFFILFPFTCTVISLFITPGDSEKVISSLSLPCNFLLVLISSFHQPTPSPLGLFI